MISVIIPARNASATVGRTLSSLVADRGLIHEILLIDDGSDDDTAETARRTADREGLPLTVINVDFGNAGAARNVGLAKAGGKRLFFLDADDEVIPGGIALLNDALDRSQGAGVAIGGSVHRGRKADKLKLPGNYSSDCRANVRRYLGNELRSITVGSALVQADASRDIRFPESIGLDEDTLYWSAILSRCQVVSVERPVLVYNLDEARMARRFVINPQRVFFDIALEIDRLSRFGVGKDALRKRKAFIALRIARHLIRYHRYSEAVEMIGVARSNDASVRTGLKSLQYRARILRAARSHTGSAPAIRHEEAPSVSRRTLILTVDPAFPPISGADLRNYRNAQVAAGIGEVCVVSVYPLSETQCRDKGIRLETLARAGEERGKSIAHMRTRIQPRISHAMLGRFRELIAEFRPDTVIVEGIGLFDLAARVRSLVPRLMIDMHNIESQLALAHEPRRFRLSGWIGRWRIRRLEHRGAEIADGIWVCSEIDRDRANSLLGSRIPVYVVPNGIPRVDEAPARLPVQADRLKGWPVMLFAGHLGYRPNVVAAQRLSSQILPRIRKFYPSARLILAGRNPGSIVSSLSLLSGVEVIANPPDMSLLLAGAHLAMVPLEAGGGTRIKILEAMAWGVPVIATALAAEGQGFQNGREILIADSDDDLADAVVNLCSDSESLVRQRTLAYEAVLERFGSSAMEKAVRAALGIDADLSSNPRRGTHPNEVSADQSGIQYES